MVIDRQRVGGSAKIQSGPGAASNIPRAAPLLRPLKPDRWRNRDYATPGYRVPDPPASSQ